MAGIDLRDEAWDEWISGERRRIGGLACDVLEKLGRMELEAGRLGEALRLAEDCIRRDIFREEIDFRLQDREFAFCGTLGREFKSPELYLSRRIAGGVRGQQRLLFPLVGFLQSSNINLIHLKHCLHGSPGFFSIRVAHHLDQNARNNLP
jgi:hypothetical protein